MVAPSRSMAASLVAGAVSMTSTERARAGLARGERHALRGVARADGPDAARQLSRRQLRDGVHRAANLERPDRLEHLELEEDLRRVAADRIEPNQRRARGRRDEIRGDGRANGVDGDVARM